MPLIVLNFTSVCSVKVSHMTDSVDPALVLFVTVKMYYWVTSAYMAPGLIILFAVR